MSAYIPTNVISITDGQIYLESDLFAGGIRPAINVGLSVSRVGGSAQIPAMKKYAGPLRTSLARYRELEAFSQFASDLDAATKAELDRGQRMVELLKQGQYMPMNVSLQVLSIFAGTQGFLDDIAVADVGRFESELQGWVKANRSSLLDDVAKARKKPELKALEEGLRDAIGTFKSSHWTAS